MTLAIPMELNPLDSVIKGAAVLASAVQRTLLETQTVVQEYITTTQASTEARDILKSYFIELHSKLKKLENSYKNTATQLKKAKSINDDIDTELKIILLMNNAQSDLIFIRDTYKRIQDQLKQVKELSLWSWSISRQFDKAYKSLDQSLKSIDRALLRFNQLRHYSVKEYQAYQHNQLLKVAALTPQPIQLDADDLRFILESIDKPPKPPTPAMQRALEHYHQCS